MNDAPLTDPFFTDTSASRDGGIATRCARRPRGEHERALDRGVAETF
jgi:hypothetical protein